MQGSFAEPLSRDTPHPRAPRWWPLILGTLVGYVRAVLSLLLPMLAVWAAFGVDPHRAGAGASWPFERAGAWSVVAGIAYVLPALAVASLCIRGSVEKRISLPVSASWLFAGMAASYYVVAALGGDVSESQLVTVVATAALVRWLAVGRQPLWRAAVESVPVRRRLAAVAALAVAAIGIGLVGTAYAFTHPLAQGGAAGSSWGPDGRRYAYEIRNGTFAGLTVTGARLRGVDARRFDVVGFVDHIHQARGPTTSRISIAPYSGQVVVVALRVPCPSTRVVPGPAGFELRYRLLGRSFRQFVRLDATHEFCGG